MGEKPFQLLREVRKPLPKESGKVEVIDNEYKSACSIFIKQELDFMPYPAISARFSNAGTFRNKSRDEFF